MSVREEFEQWAEAYHTSLGNFYTRPGGMFALQADGEYQVRWLQSDFVAWQASRESLVIDLPADLDWRSAAETRDMCADRIRAAGLKVKP